MNPNNLFLQIILAVRAAVAAVELENDEPGSGVEKKAKALEIIGELLAPVLPDWAEPMAGLVAGYLIDAFVTDWNRRDAWEAEAGAAARAAAP